MSGHIYGYCRISTNKQRIERQIDNIKKNYPDALIVAEAYTGTTVSRPGWNKLYKKLQAGDVVIFDEVSRMSRNAEEGFSLYEELFRKGVELIFIKEPHINTSVYRKALERRIEVTADTGSATMDKYINGQMELLNALMMDLARDQIDLAFQSAQAEIDYLHQRTSEGVRRAQLEGKAVGRPVGKHITTKKSVEAKKEIIRLSSTFEGTLDDIDVIRVTGISRNTYYKYKRELRAEYER